MRAPMACAVSTAVPVRLPLPSVGVLPFKWSPVVQFPGMGVRGHFTAKPPRFARERAKQKNSAIPDGSSSLQAYVDKGQWQVILDEYHKLKRVNHVWSHLEVSHLLIAADRKRQVDLAVDIVEYALRGQFFVEDHLAYLAHVLCARGQIHRAVKVAHMVHDFVGASKTSVATYTTIMRYLLKTKSPEDLELVETIATSLPSKGMRPDTEVFELRMKAHALRGDMDEVERTFASISKPKATTYNTLIDLHSRKGNFQRVAQLVTTMVARRMRVAPQTFHSIIESLAEAQDWQGMHKWFDTMLLTIGRHQKQVRPDNQIFEVIIRNITLPRDVNVLEYWLNAMVKYGNFISATTFSNAVHRMAAAGRMEWALLWLNKGTKMRRVTSRAFVSIMAEMIRRGSPVARAGELWNQMKLAGKQPWTDTYHQLFIALIGRGMVAELLDYYHEMVDLGIARTSHTYSLMSEALGFGELDHMWSLMEADAVPPSIVNYQVNIRVCIDADQKDAAYVWLQRALEWCEQNNGFTGGDDKDGKAFLRPASEYIFLPIMEWHALHGELDEALGLFRQMAELLKSNIPHATGLLAYAAVMTRNTKVLQEVVEFARSKGQLYKDEAQTSRASETLLVDYTARNRYFTGPVTMRGDTLRMNEVSTLAAVARGQGDLAMARHFERNAIEHVKEKKAAKRTRRGLDPEIPEEDRQPTPRLVNPDCTRDVDEVDREVFDLLERVYPTMVQTPEEAKAELEAQADELEASITQNETTEEADEKIKASIEEKKAEVQRLREEAAETEVRLRERRARAEAELAEFEQDHPGAGAGVRSLARLLSYRITSHRSMFVPLLHAAQSVGTASLDLRDFYAIVHRGERLHGLTEEWSVNYLYDGLPPPPGDRVHRFALKNWWSAMCRSFQSFVPVSQYVSVMGRFAAVGDFHAAMKWFNYAKKESIQPTAAMYEAVIRAAQNAKKPKHVNVWMSKLRRSGLASHLVDREIAQYKTPSSDLKQLGSHRRKFSMKDSKSYVEYAEQRIKEDVKANTRKRPKQPDTAPEQTKLPPPPSLSVGKDLLNADVLDQPVRKPLAL